MDEPGSMRARTVEEARRGIDAVDEAILRLIARRFALVDAMAADKRARGLPAGDVERERAVLATRRIRGRKVGVPGDVVTAVWTALFAAGRARLAASGVGEGGSARGDDGGDDEERDG